MQASANVYGRLLQHSDTPLDSRPNASLISGMRAECNAATWYQSYSRPLASAEEKDSTRFTGGYPGGPYGSRFRQFGRDLLKEYSLRRAISILLSHAVWCHTFHGGKGQFNTHWYRA